MRLTTIVTLLAVAVTALAQKQVTIDIPDDVYAAMQKSLAKDCDPGQVQVRTGAGEARLRERQERGIDKACTVEDYVVAVVEKAIARDIRQLPVSPSAKARQDELARLKAAIQALPQESVGIRARKK